MTRAQYKQNWAEENRDKRRASQARYRRTHLGRVRERAARWARENPQRKNPQTRRHYKRKWEAARRATDPAFKLLQNGRLRIRLALRLSGAGKSQRTQELLGCSALELKSHLEALFRPGMTWENYGPVWHVDHRRPCASFDLLDPRQQQECFHYSNLQPLFAEENLKKGDQ